MAHNVPFETSKLLMPHIGNLVQFIEDGSVAVSIIRFFSATVVEYILIHTRQINLNNGKLLFFFFFSFLFKSYSPDEIAFGEKNHQRAHY